MSKFLIAAAFAICLIACANRRERVDLSNGHKLWAMNPREIYVAKPDDELIVGPRITRLAVSGDFVVAFCTQESIVVNGFSNTSGYSVINTRSGTAEIGLSEAQLADRISALQAGEVKLHDVSDFF